MLTEQLQYSFTLLVKELSSLWSEGILSDVKIVVEDRVFPVHRIIVASAIPYFSTLYKGRWEDKELAEIRIDGFSANAMEVILKAVYTGEFQLTEENVFEVFALADYVQISNIIDQCADFMLKIRNKEKWIHIYQVAQLYSNEKLKKASSDYILDNFKALCTTPAFMELTEADLIHFLASDRLVCEEMCAFETAVKWLQHSENRLNLAMNILPYVRFGCGKVTFNELRDMLGNPFIRQNVKCNNLLVRAIKYRSMNRVGRLNFPREAWMEPRGERCLLVFGKWHMQLYHDRLCNSDLMAVSISDDNMSTRDLSHSFSDDSPLRVTRSGHHMVQVGNACYITGGVTGEALTVPKSTEFLSHDLDTNSTEVLPSMLEGRSTHVSFYTSKSELVVAGGKTADCPTDSVEIYSLSDMEWRSGPPLLRCRASAASCNVLENGFVSGGQYRMPTIGNHDCYLTDTEMYISDLGQWQAKANMNKARASHSMWCFEDKVYVFGGIRGEFNTTNYIEYYSNSTDQWTLVPNLPLLPNHMLAVPRSEEKVILFSRDDGADISRRSVFSMKTHSIEARTSVAVKFYLAPIVVAKLQHFKDLPYLGSTSIENYPKQMNYQILY